MVKQSENRQAKDKKKKKSGKKKEDMKEYVIEKALGMKLERRVKRLLDCVSSELGGLKQHYSW